MTALSVERSRKEDVVARGKERSHRPHQLGPRVYRAKGSRWFRVDLRPWGGQRVPIRNPEDPGWPDHGERTDLEAVAEQWKWAYLALVRDEHRRRVLRLGRSPQALSDATEKFLLHRSKTVEKATLSANRTGTVHLLRHFGGAARTNTITAPLLQDLVNELLGEGYLPSTVEAYARSWRIFFEWCHFGVCGKALRQNANRRRLAEFFDPVAELSIPDPGKTDVETLTDAEILRLMAAAALVDTQQIGQFPSAVMACGVGLFMGLRMGEIFALSWGDIAAPARTVRPQLQVPKDSLVLKPLKGKRARTALILPGWWEHHRTDSVGFVCGRTGRPVGSRTQRNLITRVLDTANLNRVGWGWHVLRHTYARTFLAQGRGGSLEQLQRSLGHSSIVTTQDTYGHFHEDVAARLASERIYGS